jgi:parvulin-like peptidyl-prolyl isomerase
MMPKLFMASTDFIRCCIFISLFLAFCVLTSGCDLFSRSEHQVAVVVGSREIGINKFKKDLEFVSAGLNLTAKKWDQTREQLIEKVIDHYLIIEFGKEKAIRLSEKEFQSALQEIKSDYSEREFKDALFRGYVDHQEWEMQLRETLLVRKILSKVMAPVAPPTPQEMKEYFEKYRDRFVSPEMVTYRQIVTGSKETAKKLLDRLNRGEDMSELARKHSISPEADKGGLVDQVARDYLDETIEKCLFSLEKGKISQVVKTAYGYHIFQLVEVRPKHVKSLSEVSSEIELALGSQKREQFCKKWLKELRTRFQVKVNNGLLKTL